MENTITSQQPIQYDFTQILNEEDVAIYWNRIFKVNELKEDETARIVFQAKVKGEFRGKYENLKDFEITDNIQLKSPLDLINYLKNKIISLPNHDCGISISSGIFEYDPNNLNEKGNVKAPSINTFKKLNTVVLDIDAHIKGTKERFPVYSLEDNYKKMVIIRSYIELQSLLLANGFSGVIPSFTMVTGGGIQIAFDFDADLYAGDAKLIFNRLGSILGKKTFGVLIKDIMGNFSEIIMDFDASFKDISHTQRAAGILHQKYGNMPTFETLGTSGIFDFFNQETLKEEFTKIITEIDTEILSSAYTDIQKKSYEDYYIQIIKSFQKLSTSTNDLVINKEILLEDARIDLAQNKNNLNVLNTNPLEYELVQGLKQKIQDGLFDLKALFPEINFEDHGSYWKILCPFHEESKPSMAVYKNSLKFEDFHDSTSYSITEVFMKIHDVSKGDAINKIGDLANIKFKKGDRKEFEKMEIQELIEVLIDKINTDDYVYYRLANKNRACIIRHIDSGETFSFDGMHLLANHVLSNQLSVTDIDFEFQKEFARTFEMKIIIEAFEEFQPGKPTVFQRNFIKFVNLWVPSKNYENAHSRNDKLKEEFEEQLEVSDTIIMLKEKTPWTYKYILQLVQKGDLEWFINWLTATANHYVLPTIPVFFGVPGAGKNLFVSTVIEWYVNSEFTKILSTDRLMSNFNSILESCSLMVLDEGDFSTQKSNDALKLITGSDKLLIEKKGVDTQAKAKKLNILMFSNGNVPARHPSADRRMVYFNSEITLLELTESLGVSIEEFVSNVKEELELFWAIILNNKLDKPRAMTNIKNATFWTQILKMHPSGELILQMLCNDWKEIGLQLNENVSDPLMMKNNLELLEQIKEQFNNSGAISLTLINRYLQSLNYKVHTSVQRFLGNNNLEFFGISIEIKNSEVLLIIDKKKLRTSLNINNIILEEIPEITKKIKRVQTKIKKMDPTEALSAGDGELAKEDLEHEETSRKTEITEPIKQNDLKPPKLKNLE
jgi:hypothetical protein